MKKLLITTTIIVIIATIAILYLRFSGCNQKQAINLPPLLKPAPGNTIHPISGHSPDHHKPAPLPELIDLVKKVDIDAVRGKKFRVAICMHDLNNDWSRALIKGVKEVLTQYNINIIAITDGEFNMKKQLADYRAALNLKPDLIITLPLDSKKSAPPLRKAVKQQIKLVFADTVPEGFQPGKDYTGWAVGDSYSLGTLSARILSNHLKERGKVALLHWKNKMFTVDQRSLGAREYLQTRQNITIVKELYFGEFHEIPDLITTLLREHPDLNGLWTVWDTPALEALKTLKKLNHKLPVTTVDLSKEVATELQKRHNLIGTAADHPYHQGITLGLLAIAALNQIAVPPYHVIHAEEVTLKTLPESWKRIFRTTLPPQR